MIMQTTHIAYLHAEKNNNSSKKRLQMVAKCKLPNWEAGREIHQVFHYCGGWCVLLSLSWMALGSTHG